MRITYDDTKKELPAEQLFHLFYMAGWAGTESSPDPETLRYFNVPFVNSTIVISAWENDRLVGVVRVLSDQFIRSVIYDLVVDPEHRNMGIGQELVKRCIARFPDTEWLVQTEKHISGFYEKIGFKIYNDVVLTIPSKYQHKD